MIHFTAGLIDVKEQDDTSVEEAMCKLYSSQWTWQCIDEALQVITAITPITEAPTYEKFYKDARCVLFYEENNEMIRIFIAMSALRYSGDKIRDSIMKMRNPLLHPV